MYSKLVPLKIPSGWVILHNSFGDEVPIIKNGVIINDEFYNEDLLSIEQLKFDGKCWIIDSEGYIFDLGWYPEASPDGCYRLILFKGDWNNIILEFESKKSEQICQVIEQCFDFILQGVALQDISEFIEDKTIQYQI